MEPSFPEPFAANNLATAVATLHNENGYAVPNRFEVIILAPMPNYAKQREVSLRCESILLPGRNLNTTTDGMPYGPTREVVDGVTYAEDITMTFVASAGLEERIFFAEWQELAFNKQTWNVGFYNDYVSTIEIYMLNRQDERRYGIKLIEAFPKTINGTELSQATSGEIIRTSVTFSFRYWETLDTQRQPPSLTLPTNNSFLDASVNSVERNIAANLPATVKKLNPFSGLTRSGSNFPTGPGDGLL